MKLELSLKGNLTVSSCQVSIDSKDIDVSMSLDCSKEEFLGYVAELVKTL